MSATEMLPTDRDYTDLADRGTDTGAFLERGQWIELVRWTLAADGWKPETIRARYRGRTGTSWYLGDGDKPMLLSRADWEPVVA